jgi:uncharacterized protein with FMN-binding domain
VTNRLVALSSAAVLTVYGAGYLRTRAAAERLNAAERPRVQIPDSPGGWTQARTPPPSAPDPLVSDLTAAPSPAGAAPQVASSIPEPAATPTPDTGASAGGTPSQPTAAARKSAEPVATAPVAVAADAPPVTTADELQAAASPAAQPVQASTAASATASPTNAPVAAAPVTAPVVQTPPAPVPPADPAPQPPAPPASHYKDGTYSGWGTSRHGDIKATVVVESGRIVSAVIAECWTRYSCSWVAHLQGQVVARQSQEVDYVSGATQSANAFYYAVSEALSKAK